MSASYECPCGWSRVVLTDETMDDARRAHERTDIHRMNVEPATQDRILCPVYAERVAAIGETLGGMPWGRCSRCYTPTTLDEVNTGRGYRSGLTKAHAEPRTIDSQVCPDWAEGAER